MERITRLVIRHEKTHDGYRELLVRIADDGSLVLDGAEAGETARQAFGDWDYEYWLTVPADYKDSVLLHLIKDRFSTVHEMKTWLEERGLPCELTSF